MFTPSHSPPQAEVGAVGAIHVANPPQAGIAPIILLVFSDLFIYYQALYPSCTTGVQDKCGTGLTGWKGEIQMLQKGMVLGLSVFLVCMGIKVFAQEKSEDRVVSERLIAQIDLSS